MGRPRRGKITDPDLERFMALGEPSRWAMVRLLAERPRSVGEVAQALQLSLAVTSRHLQKLRAAGLVVARREGKALVCGIAGRGSESGRWLAAALGAGAAGRATARAAAVPAEVAGAAEPGPERALRPRAARDRKHDLDDFLL